MSFRKNKNGYTFTISRFWLFVLLLFLFDATFMEDSVIFRTLETISTPSDTEPIPAPEIEKPRINPDIPPDTPLDDPGLGILWLVVPLSILLVIAFKIRSFLDDPANLELVRELFYKPKENDDP